MTRFTATCPDRPPYGLRGWELLVTGLAWVGLGTSYITAPSETAQADTYTVVQQYTSLTVWGFVWLITGVVGVLAGVLRHHGVGYVALILMPGGWGIGLVAATVLHGDPRAWVLGLVFVLLAVKIGISSRMEDARLIRARLVQARLTTEHQDDAG